MTLTAVLAISSPIVREGVALLLADAGIVVVECVPTPDHLRSPEEAVVAVVDVEDDQTWSAIGSLRTRAPSLRIVAVHDGLGAGALQRGSDAGVTVFVDVAAGASSLVDAVRGDLDRTLRRWERPQVGLAPLTVRERGVLVELARGSTLRETSEHMGISIHSVERAKRKLLGKLGASDHAQAVAIALQYQLLDEIGAGQRGSA